MKEDDFQVSETGGTGQTVWWSKLSDLRKLQAWGWLDARSRETAREVLGRTWRGRSWLRAHDRSGWAARDKSAVESAEKKAEAERLRAERAKEEERLRADLKPRLLEEIRGEWAAEKVGLEGTVGRLNGELRELRGQLQQEGAETKRLRTELDRAHAHTAKVESDRNELNTELETLRKKIGTKDGINVQLAEKRAELARLSDKVEKVNNEHDALWKEFDASRRQFALRRKDRFLWDAAPVELVEHMSFLVPDARTDGAIAVLIHRGMPPAEIAKSLHVSKERVATVLEGDGENESVLNETREWMGPAPDGYYPDEKLTGAELVAKVWELHDGGKTQRQIARLTGARLATVNEILKAPKPVAAANAPTSEHGTAAPSES